LKLFSNFCDFCDCLSRLLREMKELPGKRFMDIVSRESKNQKNRTPATKLFAHRKTHSDLPKLWKHTNTHEHHKDKKKRFCHIQLWSFHLPACIISKNPPINKKHHGEWTLQWLAAEWKQNVFTKLTSLKNQQQNINSLWSFSYSF
jgi:hypothetical protein